MDTRHLIGALIALALSGWASFSFFRGSITGAHPLYSRGWSIPPLTAAIPKSFWTTSCIRLALKSWAEMRTVRNNVTKTNRLIDWIVFEHVSHAYKGSSSILGTRREPRGKDRSRRSTAADFPSNLRNLLHGCLRAHFCAKTMPLRLDTDSGGLRLDS
jgi:hypothetical protein